MSYDISFKAKAEGIDYYVDTKYCHSNITFNVRNIIIKSTGLAWGDGNLGLCKDIIKNISTGLVELLNNQEEYFPLESSNGWGTVKGVIAFFYDIINSYNTLKEEEPELAEVVTFWVEA